MVRQRRIAEERASWKRRLAEHQREIDAHNARVDKLDAGFREHDRFAVSEYVQIVLDRSPYPTGFPSRRRAGYVPESSLLAVEWYLPTVDIVPEYKTYKHIKTRKAVEPTSRPLAETGRLYQSVTAQIALRTLGEIFHSTPEDMVSTVVFNGRVTTIDPLTGQTIQPHLITLRATREQFAPLILEGIMITTSGYGPDSYKFAAGKPINLIDGSGLLSLCQEHDISARILKSRL